MSRYLIIGAEDNIYQEKIGEDFLSHHTEKIIASFDSMKLANDYIERSRLEHPQRIPFGSDIVFKSNSLLRNCQNAWVKEEFQPDPIPHNPEIL